MLRRKVAESLTARIFWMTTLILLLAGAMTFGLIAWATPSTYTAVVSDDLARQVDALVDELANTALQECGPVLERFLHASGAQAMLVGPDGQIAGTGQWFTVERRPRARTRSPAHPRANLRSLTTPGARRRTR